MAPILLFISVTTLMASTGEEKNTKPNPPLQSPSVTAFLLVICWWSSKLFLETFINTTTAIFQLKVHTLVTSDPILLHLFKFALKFCLAFHFFWSEPKQQRFVFPLSPLPFISSTAFCMSSCLSKLPSPNSLDFPLSLVVLFTPKAGPDLPKRSLMCSSSLSSPKFLM